MLDNGPITLINADIDPQTRFETLSKQSVPKAFVEAREGAAIESAGMRDVDVVKAYILFDWLDDPSALIPDKTYLVRGEVLEDVSTMTVTDLRKRYPETYQVTTIDKRDFGSQHMHHWEVGAR